MLGLPRSSLVGPWELQPILHSPLKGHAIISWAYPSTGKSYFYTFSTLPHNLPCRQESRALQLGSSNPASRPYEAACLVRRNSKKLAVSLGRLLHTPHRRQQEKIRLLMSWTGLMHIDCNLAQCASGICLIISTLCFSGCPAPRSFTLICSPLTAPAVCLISSTLCFSGC